MNRSNLVCDADGNTKDTHPSCLIFLSFETL